MLSFVKVQKKAHRFYEICTNRLLRFPALADALLSEITGGGEQFTMKRSRNSNEHALAVQKPAPESGGATGRGREEEDPQTVD